jgi:hypothetical protein
MHTGMLWFDNSNIDIVEKIKKGVEYYAKKYNRKPDMVLVHPSMILVPGRGPERVGMIIDGIHVKAYRPVLPGHIWIGIKDKEEAGAE